MKTTTFSKIATKSNQCIVNEEKEEVVENEEEYQLNDYILPQPLLTRTSNSTNCFLNSNSNNNKTKSKTNWHSDSNLYRDEDDEDDDDDDELIFSDHVGLFKSINNENGEEDFVDEKKAIATASYNDDEYSSSSCTINKNNNKNNSEFKKKLSSNAQNHYKLCRLSNEKISYDLDSINNWSMRFSNEFINQQQIQHKKMTKNVSCSASQTSWNKLKNSKSNQNLNTSSSTATTTTSSTNNNSRPLIKYYKSKKYSTNATTDDDNEDETQSTRIKKRSLLSKSPTITFGELRQRYCSNSSNRVVFSSSSSSNICCSTSLRSLSMNCNKQSSSSVATQYPPYLMDQSIQTSTFINEKSNYHKVNACLQATEADIINEIKAVNSSDLKNKDKGKHASLVKFFYKSLPDLSFLANYKDDDSKSVALPASQQTSNISVPTSSIAGDNEIKLLISSSSIDKQRKTLKSIKRYRQTKQNTEPCAQQAAITVSIPTKATTTTTNSVQTQQQQRKLRPSESFSTKTITANKATNVPTSSNSSSSSSSSGYISADKVATIKQPLVVVTTATKPTTVPLKSCLKRKDSASSNSSECRSTTIRRYNSVAAAISYDRSTNKAKAVNKNLLVGTRITNEMLNSMPIFIQSIGWLFTCNIKSLKAYSYYKSLKVSQQRVLTVDTSKINIIKEDEEEEAANENVNEEEEKQEPKRQQKLRNSRSDNDLRVEKKVVSFNDSISRHTITPPQSQSSPSTADTPRDEEDLLKYNSLIQLLKTKTNPNSKHQIQRHDSIEKLKLKLNKNNVYIDVDSISLGSLTESPPNEFKFFEEDEEEQLPNTVDLSNYFTSSQQQQLFSELKVVIFQLNEIYLKEQELNNEKQSILNLLLKDNLCLILFNLLKDNLRLTLNEPIIKQNVNSEFKTNELRYEQLCKLFQYLLSIKFIQQQQQLKTPCQNQMNADEPLFILNEATSKQKFEAFVYFFLNIKQLSNIIEYINSDKILLNRYYDLTNLNLNNSSLIFLNEIIFNEFLQQIKQFNKYKFKLKYLFPKQQQQQVVIKQSTIEQQPQQQSGIIIKSKSPSPPKLTLIQQQQQTNNSFNLKTISKKFNIKSWFSSKQQQQQQQQQISKSRTASNENMKYSFSEPMINEFSVNFNPNSSKL